MHLWNNPNDERVEGDLPRVLLVRSQPWPRTIFCDLSCGFPRVVSALSTQAFCV